MKILISISYYTPHISGLTDSIKNLVELLTKKGYSITVLTTQLKKDLPRKELIQNVKVIRVPYLFKIHKGFFMPGFIFSTINALNKTDQVVITLPEAEGVIVALLAKLMKKKIHCIYICEVTLSKNLSSKLIEKFLRFTNSITLSLADSIVTLTDDFAKHNQLLIPYSKKVRAIYPVVIAPDINTSLRKDIEKKLIPKKQHYIGFIGRISAEKGLEYLLETIPILRESFGNNFAIVLAGPTRVIGEENYFDKITSIINKYKENIIVLGELKSVELGLFYTMIDVLILPSVNSTEAFGMVQVESMFCGTPVIATDLPGVRVPIQVTHMGEIVPQKDVTALAKKIIKVIQNKKKYIKNKEIIRKIFSVEKIISEYEKIFTDFS